MRTLLLAAAFITATLLTVSTPALGNPWGANYFPNVPLTTQDGETVHFFDDLLKDKVVAINFIYTTCPDTCPLETAKLVSVQNILGDRLGEDVFFYSITIDPDVDTPEVLKEYKERFEANWDFFTGDEKDIILLRRKLGLYVEEIQDGSNNHNVNMIIGNQKTGRWMKRSPFENPYVLADQLGNWLTGWKSVQKSADYSTAPELRNIDRGEQMFRNRCSDCHSLTGKERAGALGPDLLGVTMRREMPWLLNWLRAPDEMLEAKDPLAIAMYERYNRLAMPNMRLNQEEAWQLIDYFEAETERITGRPVKRLTASKEPEVSKADGDVVAIMNAWVRESHPKAKVNAGYMTLVNVGEEELTLVKVESEAFGKIEIHEMTTVDGLMKMRELDGLVIPPKGQAQLLPGGQHLMLKRPKDHLTSGEKVDMTLTFDSGEMQKVSLNVDTR